ncbi:hypothetical protein E6P97_00055 [Patescibacteria group bacterium]|nr:MAG: hypothetical protein E6P97_00055 [Patescibacteria group bacterium]
MKSHMPRQKLDQSGMVSIIVTMIMMVIMSLVILGFARVSRREMRQGLDRQLASQANYAAETGIDDARAYLASGLGLSSNAATACNEYPQAGRLTDTDITVGIDSVVTSCVLVTGAVNDLVYDSVGTNEEVLFPIRMESGNVDSFVIEWQDPGVAVPDFSQCESDPSGILDHMPRLADWQCPTAMLRVDMVPVTGSVSRSGLTSRSRGFVLLPSRTLQASSSPVNVDDGRIYRGLCQASASPKCRSAVISVSGSYGASQSAMYVRIRPLYRSAQLRISANSGQAMIGAQAVIDSTGRANDVLKRLVVRVPTCPSGIACGKRPANSALQLAETLCKQYGVIPAPTPTINVESSDAACQLP